MNKLVKLFTFWLICAVTYASNSFYSSHPQILELNARNFDKVVHKSNYTTLVEFYAPWCGHCQNLKSVFEKAANKLDGLVQVAAVNCDLNKNKELCASYGIEGFPTIKVFRPQKVDLKNSGSKFAKNFKKFNNSTSKVAPKKKTKAKLSRNIDETYMGARSLAPIVQFCMERIKNYVIKIGRSESLYKAIEIDPLKRPVIIFSKNDSISPLLKSIAIDWLEQFSFYSVFKKNVSKISTDGEFYAKYPGIVNQLNKLIDDFGSNKTKNSKLFVLDGVNDTLILLDEAKIKKETVAKFLIDQFNVTPKEGPFSERAKFLGNVRLGKKPSKKNNTKKSGKKTVKSTEKKSKGKNTHDEL